VARLRTSPDDFVVDELPLYRPEGRGEHTFLHVEKRDRTTEGVARDLARAAGLPPGAVGYAGRKDRRAVTRQWFSVPGLDPERARELALPGARVLDAIRHPHKLRTGQLRGNRFEIRVRDVDAGLAERAEARLGEIERRGMPNRFGAQRFGRDAGNLPRAQALLRQGGSVADRRDARFLLSALQAAVFNEVLAVRPEPLDRVVAGDVAVIHASGGLFRVEDADREAPRALAFEVSATGPIFGGRALEPGGVVAERERAVLERFGIAAAEGHVRWPRGVRLRGTRRSLRVRPSDASVEREADALRLRFTLPAGSYATVLVEELLGAEMLETG
jgi:tRNA pseudouridine13 synthase